MRVLDIDTVLILYEASLNMGLTTISTWSALTRTVNTSRPSISCQRNEGRWDTVVGGHEQ